MAEIYDNLGTFRRGGDKGVKLADALHHTMQYYDHLDIATGYYELECVEQVC